MKILLKILPIFFLTIIAINHQYSQAFANDNTLQAIKLYNEGVKYHQSSKYDIALSYYQQSFSIEKRSKTAYAMAKIYYRKNMLQEAKYYITEAINLKTENFDLLIHDSQKLLDHINWKLSHQPQSSLMSAKGDDSSSISLPMPQPENEVCFTTSRVSDETMPAICPNGYLMKGITCRGKRCDDKYIRCCRSKRGLVHNNTFWSGWFSEEANNTRFYPDGVLIGLACNGGYCDNLNLYAMPMVTGKSSSCFRMNFYSEEQGYGECPDYYVVSGITCTGDNCDNIALFCCPE